MGAQKHEGHAMTTRKARPEDYEIVNLGDRYEVRCQGGRGLLYNTLADARRSIRQRIKAGVVVVARRNPDAGVGIHQHTR